MVIELKNCFALDFDPTQGIIEIDLKLINLPIIRFYANKVYLLFLPSVFPSVWLIKDQFTAQFINYVSGKQSMNSILIL